MKSSGMDRRSFLRRLVLSIAGLGYTLRRGEISRVFSEGIESSPIPRRALGRTGVQVTLFGFGGEGVLRTYDRMREAVPVIRRALDLGVNYFDTAPAYSQSQDYYGAALGERRKDIFLASKTHDRSYDGSMRLLEDSLKRIRTDHLDLWQLHDLRDPQDLTEIFDEKRGAIRALEEARSQGLVRYLGITGHSDPSILAQALNRYPFDTALVALNAADRRRRSFIEGVLPAAREKGVGVIGMKVLARGAILDAGLSLQEAFSYVLSLPVSTVIIGCSSPREVEENVAAVKAFSELSGESMNALEKRVFPMADRLCFYKAW